MILRSLLFADFLDWTKFKSCRNPLTKANAPLLRIHTPLSALNSLIPWKHNPHALLQRERISAGDSASLLVVTPQPPTAYPRSPRSTRPHALLQRKRISAGDSASLLVVTPQPPTAYPRSPRSTRPHALLQRERISAGDSASLLVVMPRPPTAYPRSPRSIRPTPYSSVSASPQEAAPPCS